MATWIAFILLSLDWGSSYLFIRIGVRQLSPVDLVALRVTVGALTILVIALAVRRLQRITRQELGIAFILATLNTTIPFILISWAEKTVPSGLTAVLNSTTPIFSVLIAGALLHDERITASRLGGVAVGFIGVVLLASRDLSGAGVNWAGLISQGAVVAAAALYAVSAVLTRTTLRGVHWMTLATYALCIAAAECLLLSAFSGLPSLRSLHPSSVIAVLWLGVLGSGLAYLLYYFIIGSWGASRATLVTYVIPVISIALGAIFLGETLEWKVLVGSVLVIAGVVLASRTPPQEVPEQETEVELRAPGSA